MLTAIQISIRQFQCLVSLHIELVKTTGYLLVRLSTPLTDPIAVTTTVGDLMKIIAIVITLVGVPSAAIAEKISVLDLTDYEKSLHRWAWCQEVHFSTEICEYGCNDIGTIGNLLYNNDRRSSESDPRGIYRQASQDIAAELLLGEVIATEEILEKCEADMLQILRSEYVPNFEYLDLDDR